jgi:hypothetical protein
MSRNNNKNRDKQTKPAERKKRMFYFGPGVIIALILAVIIGGNSIKSEMQRRQASKMPPIVERQIVSSGQDRLGPVPEVKFLIDRQKPLGLSEAQTVKLEKLQSAWEKYSVPRMKKANEAAKHLNDYMSRAEDNKQTPAVQVQNEAAPVVAISGEISSQRRAYWSQAVQVLSPEQRKLADTEREKDYAAKRKAHAESIKNNR